MTLPHFVVTDDTSYIRDTKNRALLQTDRGALDRHRAARTKATTLSHKILSLERELADLKATVQQLLHSS